MPQIQGSTLQGRGRLFSMVQAAAPVQAKQETPSEVSSTTDALAQLRMTKRSESSSEAKAPTMQQLEAEAAPLEEVQEAVVEARVGKCGKSSPFY